MELKDVIHILKTGERQGAETDEPEGARYIVISETLVDEMIGALEKYPDPSNMAETVRFWLDKFKTISSFVP
jgi:hypothetical protein